MARQLARPQVLSGRLFLGGMPNRTNALVFDVMAIDLSDQVLEVGFGGGDLQVRLAGVVADARVEGIELLDPMPRRVSARIHRCGWNDRDRLQAGSVASLLFVAGQFACACSVNTIDFRPDLHGGLSRADAASRRTASARIQVGRGVAACRLRGAQALPLRHGADRGHAVRGCPGTIGGGAARPGGAPRRLLRVGQRAHGDRFAMSSARVRVDVGLSLHCETSGRKATMVLLVPGSTMTTAVFARQVEHFSGSPDDRFVTIAPRARGESTETASGHYDARCARVLEALIDAPDLDCIRLGGWYCGPLGSVRLRQSVRQSMRRRSARRLIMPDGPPRAAGVADTKNRVSYRHDDTHGHDVHLPLGRLTDHHETNRAIAHVHARRCGRVCRALGSVSNVRSAVSTRRGFGRCIAMPSQ